MSLYPSLEDMKVDQMCKAQISQMGLQSDQAPPPYPTTNPDSMPMPSNGSPLYPSLGEYMGLELSEAVIAENMPEYSQIAVLQQVRKLGKCLYSLNNWYQRNKSLSTF